MKKLIKILGVFVACLVLMTSFFYIPNNKSFLLSTSANIVSNPTYSYNAELVEDNMGMGNYAVEDIEYLEVNGAPLIHFRVTGRSQKITLLTSNPYWVDMRGFVLNTSQTNNTNYTNFAVTTNSFSYLTLTNSTQYDLPINGQTYYLQTLNLLAPNSSVYFDLYFSFYELKINSDLSVTPVTDGTTSYQNRLIHNDFSPLIDMSSLTQYSFNITDIFGDSTCLMSYISRIYTLNDAYYGTVGGSVNLNSFNTRVVGPSGNPASDYWNANQYSFYSFDLSAFSNDLTLVNKSFDYYFNDFFFYVKKPSYRVDNTFFIFNYSYDESLNNFNLLTYQLRKGNDYYNVSYSGSIPNSKYLAFNCPDINNIIFDEYIYVDFKFTDNVFNPYDYGFTNENLSFTYILGFDLNFVYYTEPLVASRGVYNFNFEKPAYVSADIEFSVVPPRISLPILAWVENAFIFLFFYCPIISDIFSLLHFDLFFGALIDIIDIYTSSLIGDFVLGCVGFILFYGILKSLIPTVFVSVQSLYEDSQISFNRKARKEEKQKSKYNSKQLKYKFKQVDKEYKLKEKRKKKGLPD